MPMLAPLRQQISAHHRRRGQRDNQRYRDRHRQGHRAGTADPFANRFPVGLDRVSFFDCFAASPGDESSHGISNHPDFPDK
jgi:hypothetical protein